MRILLIGMFIIALLAGLAAKQLNQPSSDQRSWAGHVMNAVGLKDQERVERVQFNEIVHRFIEQKTKFTQNLQDQQQYLEGSRSQMASLTQIIKDRTDGDSNVDLLRLKDLMQRYQDQSTFLIEHGKELMQLNEQQIKIREKAVENADLASILSKSDRDQFIQGLRGKLDHQNDLMKQRMADSEALRDKMRQIKDQIQAMHDGAVSNKSQAALDKLKEDQEHLREINQKNLMALGAIKEKIDDLKQRNADQLAGSREHTRDQQQLLKDRLQDQLDRIRDQHNK
ncbi:MAG: hypothetical protein HY209_04320 [Candidatus Omnitrophica bacterium]|nr:hypothetical protein [Candidatus Omnitrophota bacterium]